MKRVLLTGGTGFVGRNVTPYLSQRCELFTPSRRELNLFDEGEVRSYIADKGIEVVFHCANPNPVKNPLDRPERMFEESIRMFLNLYRAQEHYERMYTLGSGAEYDKSRDIVSISEEEEFRSVPYDGYGLAKFTINQLISGSEKQCNLRLFGCYGPTDHESKFITHAIRCCMEHRDITIRQNCRFDYLHVWDLARVMGFFLDHSPRYRSYNVCSGQVVTLLELAREVKRQMHSESAIVLLKEGWNREYTASNARLRAEYPDLTLTPIEEGIRLQIRSELKAGERT